MIQLITPCLWFENQAEDAARFYVSIFKNSEITTISHYGKVGFEVHGQKEGTVLIVDFILDGQAFTALNGGPVFQFNESVSFQVYCQTQGEIDYYWEKLSQDGEEGPCGWLKDKYGVSWQIVPSIIPELMADPQKRDKVFPVIMQMNKPDLDKILEAVQK